MRRLRISAATASGAFSTYRRAVKALTLAGLRVWDPDAHNADDPDIETPREPDERVVGSTALDYRLREEPHHAKPSLGSPDHAKPYRTKPRTPA